MHFVADLHIHSHLSRATSKSLDLEHLHKTAQIKGITVVGTGDFTHPRWMEELTSKLVPAEPGLYRLKDDIARAVDADVPGACRGPVRFLLSVEISSIYKRNGKTRKVHNLVFAPDLEVAGKIAARLGGIGNITSDGRPILGLDSRDLLEIVLESSPDSFLVPAHIWTPWFSALGEQSGFDSIAECFGDLAGHVFAAETGLSSDPAMNFRLSQLDRLALISSSDAHSPEKLGREATLFDCDLGYHALRDALRDRREGLAGTVEFFPEEGKYHFDGHRKCDVVRTPDEARNLGRICPKCGKPLTAGVASRVEALSDRPEGYIPEFAKPFHRLVPLAEIVGELCDVGPDTGTVRRHCERLLGRLGPELSVLTAAPAEDLDREGPPLLAEALTRMRQGRVLARAGYDGEYGVVRVFDEAERRRLLAQTSFAFIGRALGEAAEVDPKRAKEAAQEPLSAPEPEPALPTSALDDAPDPAQEAAIEHADGPLLLVAGPGTGKTRTIVQRIARLVRVAGVSPRSITAVTFTNKAADEMRDRLAALLGDDAVRLLVTTFHALGQRLISAHAAELGLPAAFRIADEEMAQAALTQAIKDAGSDLSLKDARQRISWAKAHLVEPSAADADIVPVYTAYERRLRDGGQVDFDDLVRYAVRLLEDSTSARAFIEERARYLFVDEYQDVNLAQYRFVRALAPAEGRPNICAVGDPDQAIYEFRGASPLYFQRFAADYADTTTIVLSTNYRSSASILRAATLVIEGSPDRAKRPLAPRQGQGDPVVRFTAASGDDEADRVVSEIERAVGGTSLLTSDGSVEALALHEVAVLFRISAQADAIARALDRAGIPYFIRGEESLETRFEPQKVALLSLHASKGLEFPLVIMTGCEDGLLPLRLPGLSPGDFEGERRLFYVGMTRAKKRLVLLSARRRTLFGRTMENEKCPFLEGLPKGVFLESGGPPWKRRAKQMVLF
jgi:DNA helicase-2/ATP-dependent DNA helicase PcrA